MVKGDFKGALKVSNEAAKVSKPFLPNVLRGIKMELWNRKG